MCVCVWRLACAYATVGMCNQPGSSSRLVFLCFLISVLTHAACLGTFLLTLLHDVWLPAQWQKNMILEQQHGNASSERWHNAASLLRFCSIVTRRVKNLAEA